MTVDNVFKGRSAIMGYPLYTSLNKNLNKIDVLGHGNEDTLNTIGTAETFQDLLKAYSEYNVYLNTTVESAMPRSRAEAMMCGCPTISTNNFDISKYIVHKESGFLSNNRDDILKYIKLLLSNEELAKSIGEGGRVVAIKPFNLKDYLDKWNNIFLKL